MNTTGLEVAVHRLRYGNAMVFAVHEALESGGLDLALLADALYGAHLFLGETIDKMEGIIARREVTLPEAIADATNAS